MVKLYYPEPESDCVSAWVRKQNHALLYSRLRELELKKALAPKMFPKKVGRTFGQGVIVQLR